MTLLVKHPCFLIASFLLLSLFEGCTSLQSHNARVPATSANSSQTAGLQLKSDLFEFFANLKVRNQKYASQVAELVSAINARQAAGKNVTCSYQIYRELQWRMSFTSDEQKIENQIRALQVSLQGDLDQTFAEKQSPSDGSWGPCYTETFMKLYQTHEFAAIQQGVYRESFLDQFNSPEKLKAYLDSVIQNNFYSSGEVNRVRMDDSVSALGWLIIDGLPNNYQWAPTMKAAFQAYIDGWQSPQTGLWGLKFIDKNGNLVQTGDIGTSFHIISQRNGDVNLIEKIPASILSVKDLPFPFGYKVNGHYDNHMNWDVVKIFRLAWPKLDSANKSAVEQEVTEMLKWCLAESLQEDGTFKVGDIDTTLGDAMLYGVSFLDEVGYLNARNRFWTHQEFPESVAVRSKIRSKLLSLHSRDASILEALRTLEGEINSPD